MSRAVRVSLSPHRAVGVHANCKQGRHQTGEGTCRRADAKEERSMRGGNSNQTFSGRALRIAAAAISVLLMAGTSYA